MAKLEQFNSINSIMEDGDIPQTSRNYLGYSGLGNKCMRKIWYDYRWVTARTIPKRVARIFSRGDWEEHRIIKDLAEVGCLITDDQLEVVGVTGHVKGHIDGIAIGVPTAEKTKHLFECKTMKASLYAKYLKDGLRKYSPSYWQQIHSYMGHLKLTRCLYVVVNKDTEERDFQRINFDKAQFEEGERIAFNIITAEDPPPKMANASRTFFECKWCDHKGTCHMSEKVERNCRTCDHWDIEEDGKFSCSYHIFELSTVGQRAGCDDYEMSDVYK